MNRLIKCIFFVSILIILCYHTTANAATLTEMTKSAEKFISKGAASAGNINYSGVTKEFIGIGQILTTIGAGVMVAVVTYMGIKYLTAGPEAQAKLKIQLIGVLVSGMVIFGSYTIWKIVVQIAENF